jgi:hypothetical protein
MDAAIEPTLGASITEEDKKSLEDSLLKVAQSVGPQKARDVANQLFTSGAETSAAKLLPTIYPNQFNGGYFSYGSAAFEMADCKGVNTLVIHVSEVKEAGKRWLIQDSLEEPMRGLKPKLSKCTPSGEEWPILATDEPVSSYKEIDAWAKKLKGDKEAEGFDVSIKKEKQIVLD